MKTYQVVLLSILSVLFLGTAGFFIIGFYKAKPGGLLIDTIPASSVYINGSLVGKTPFSQNYDSGAVTLKLVPEASSSNLLPFETKITLISGVQTVVRREFGTTEDSSSGDILSFDVGDDNGSLVVISTPENAQVSLDGTPKGFSPYKASDISVGLHQITIKSPGYLDRNLTVKTIKGFRLTVFAKLARNTPEATPTPTPSATPASTSYVLIGNTPTGFLRIRTEPGTAGEEIAQVKPGDKFRYLSTDTATGWYKIQYEEPVAGLPDGISGWVTNQYTTLISQ